MDQKLPPPPLVAPGDLDVERCDAPIQDRSLPVPSPDDLPTLGRQRPEVFKSIWGEIGFCFAITMSIFIAVRILVLFFFGS